MNEPRSFTSSQLRFEELFVGTLIYALVLGFFDEYTSIEVRVHLGDRPGVR